MAPTDEELLELMPQGFRDDLALVSRMAAHGAGPEVQPGLFRVTLNTGALDYARAVWDRARAALAAEPVTEGPSRLRTERRTGPFGEWTALIPCNSHAPADAGEVAELVAALLQVSDGASARGDEGTSWITARAADLLERQAAPVPVASDVYFEFVVSDADCCTQAGGIAPTYAQALSEGQHYLAQYQQDGPHTLEVRRVEVLHPTALPLPSGEPQP